MLHSHRSGFTYLELLIALSLFSVGMASILHIFPVNRKFLNQSGMTTQAVYLAQEEMEIVRSTPYDNLTTGSFEPREMVGSGSSDPFSQFERETAVQLIDASYANTATDVGLKRVTVTVYWKENGSIDRSLVMHTFVYHK